MKTYEITFLEYWTRTIEVKANNKEEALALAENLISANPDHYPAEYSDTVSQEIEEI